MPGLENTVDCIWKDISSYEQGEEKVPNTFEARLTSGIRLMVCGTHMDYPGQWVGTCQPFFRLQTLIAKDAAAAQAEATQLLRVHLRAALRDLTVLGSDAADMAQRHPTQDPKYEIEVAGDEAYLVNAASGKPIPEDCPTFTFLAKDRKALGALASYRAACDDPAHVAAVQARIYEFEQYAETHADSMKEPDTDSGGSS